MRGRTLAAFAALAVLFVAGAALPCDPGFDAGFGIEAWARPGTAACAAAAAVVLALLRWDGAAEAAAAALGRGAGRIPAAAGAVLAAVTAAAAFAAFPDAGLSGDAMDIVVRAQAGDTMPSNALTSWLHAAGVAAGLDALSAVRAVSVAAGVAGVLGAIALGRALFDDGPRRAAAAVLAATTGGAALWFGSVEVYAPLGAAVVAYLAVAVRSVRRGGPVGAPAAVLGVAFGLHGTAGLLLPSLALVAWDGGRAGAARRMAVAAAAFAAPVAVVAAGLWFFVWRGAPPSSGPELWGNFLGAGSDGPFLPLLPDAGLRARYALLDAEHALAVLSTLFVAAPAAWTLLAARRAGVAEPDARVRRFAVAALVPWIVFACVWNVTYGLRRDWDVFSAAGYPAALLAATVALREPGVRARAAQVAAIALFTFVPLVATHAGTRLERRNFALAAAWTLRGDAAARWSAEAVRLDPRGVVAAVEEGERLLDAGEPEAALRVLGAARQDEPGDPFVLEPLGRALEALGRLGEAERELRAAVATPRENLRFGARVALARLALRRRDPAEARRQLERALREDSENPLADRARAMLAELPAR